MDGRVHAPNAVPLTEKRRLRRHPVFAGDTANLTTSEREPDKR